jgi:ubiquinone/menaquinone biosynthesis C-methylase UbiE
MQQFKDYKTDTFNAYRSKQRASQYKQDQTRGINWSRFTTWREQHLLFRELSRYSWSSDDLLLDIPCGTGILGNVLQFFPFHIVACDISSEMMKLARDEYPSNRLVKFIQADITKTGFRGDSFDCVVVLGFLHRVPQNIKVAALREVFNLAKKVAVVSCSVDNPLQRLKQKLLSIINKNYVPAPCPAPLEDIIAACKAVGFKVARSFMIIPFLSAEAILVLEKDLIDKHPF